MKRSITINFGWAPYMALGAFCYWALWGNPILEHAIPFVAMLFFWPFYLIWIALFWVGVALAVVVVGGVIFLISNHYWVKRSNAKLRRSFQQHLDARRNARD